MTHSPAQRFVAGLEGPTLTGAERRAFSAAPPFGFLLLPRNLVTVEQALALVGELRSLSTPAPLLFVDQEGGTVDRLGPLLGVPFAAATRCAEVGTDRVHENAYLMGRAARLLGLDVDLAPVVDLGQPGTGAVVLPGRTFGFHAEDVVLSGTVFLHGLARAGVASCLKHFPGLGRAAEDTHVSRPVVDAHDVDLMVTDVAPFARLSRVADGVMVAHAAYPGFTGDDTPASLAPRILEILRGPVGFKGVVYSDDLAMGALDGPVPERCARAARAGCDVLVVTRPVEAYPESVARVREAGILESGLATRLAALRERCESAPRPAFDRAAWQRLAAEVAVFNEVLERPREKRPDLGWG